VSSLGDLQTRQFTRADLYSIGYLRRMRVGTVGTAQITPPLPGKQASSIRGTGFFLA
jgi:hypothetical protein